MLPEPSDSNMLLYLPDDVFAIVSRFLSPRDMCNLSLCCKSLNALVASEKIWLTQCEILGIVPHKDLVEWRKGVSSYKALCRFLLSVQPLIGIWVHQNPELGNVVYVMPGFVSVVGCRIIPQELGPLGIEDGPILWASVFEVIGDFDGSTIFFLHGREKGIDYIYPGSVKSIDKSCNVLLLEVEPGQHKKNVGALLQSKSFVHQSGVEFSRKASSQETVGPTPLELDDIRASLDFSGAMPNLYLRRMIAHNTSRGKSLGGYVWNSLKQMLGRSNSMNGSHSVSKKLTSSSEIRHARLQEFLRSSDTIRLTLNASTMKLSSYRAWPNMLDSRFALTSCLCEFPELTKNMLVCGEGLLVGLQESLLRQAWKGFILSSALL
ncbi:F-box-like domain superfamily [Sesbania bispinosa]|nr:F-box-like domain superfamily [Sesbania bispinosa]